MKIRRLSQSDLPDVWRIQRESYSQDILESVDSFSAKLSAYPDFCFMAVRREIVVGYLVALPWVFGEILDLDSVEYSIPPDPDSVCIREYREADIDQILDIWLSASIKAHDFVESEFWVSKVSDMRDVYIPAAETFVFESDGQIAGFYSLYGNTLAAIFVSPHMQGKGMGSALLDDAKSRRESLQLTVYKENVPSIKFYEKHGFISIGEQIDEHTGHPELIMEYRSSHERERLLR